MKKMLSILLSICMVISLFAGAGIGTYEAEAASAITSSDFLKANGKNLRNNYGSGDVVQLKGTNAGGYLIQEMWMTPTNATTNVSDEEEIYEVLTSRFGESGKDYLVGLYQDNYWTEADFDNCAAMGMNCIRLPFWWKNLRNDDGSLDFTRMDWFVQEAGERGMYVIIDFHGAPGSQNGSDHSGVDGGDDKLGASQFFFGSNAYNNQQIYYDMWYKIAQHYAGNPTVAAYDLLNEPYCTYRYNSGYSDDYLRTMLWDIYNNAYNVIRSADPDHVIIMEATWDPVDLPNPSQYGWSNIMYEYHNYLYDDYDNANGQQIANMKKKVDAIAAANYNVPSYMGEFCYFNNLSAWNEGLALLTDAGLSWTSWTYKVISEYGNWGLYNQTNQQANIETDSWDTLCTKYSKVGESWANTGLIDTMKPYFAKAAVSADGSSTGGSTATYPSASLGNGDYYFKVSDSSNTEWVVCGENYGNDPLIANRSAYGGDWEKVTIENNSDGTVSLKSGSNGMYVCAVIDENNQLLPRSSSIGTWEKFYLVQAGDGKYGLKAVANDLYVCADFNNGGQLRATSSSIAGSWEAFSIYTTSGSSQNSSSGTTSSDSTSSGTTSSGTTSSGSTSASTTLSDGDYYFTVKDSSNTSWVVCGENYGNDPLIANRSAFGGDWEKVTIVNNSDGTVSLKSGANGLYVCAVIDDNNQLLARSSAIQDWEKFYLVNNGDGTYGLQAVANGLYVCADFNNGGQLRAISSSVAGSWEAFTITKVN